MTNARIVCGTVVAVSTLACMTFLTATGDGTMALGVWFASIFYMGAVMAGGRHA